MIMEKHAPRSLTSQYINIGSAWFSGWIHLPNGKIQQFSITPSCESISCGSLESSTRTKLGNHILGWKLNGGNCAQFYLNSTLWKLSYGYFLLRGRTIFPKNRETETKRKKPKRQKPDLQLPRDALQVMSGVKYMASSGKLVPPRQSFSLQQVFHFHDHERKGQRQITQTF